MEETFLNNLVILVQNDTLDWKLMTKRSTFDKDGECSISTIGPDNKTSLQIKFEGSKISFLKVSNTDLKIDKLLFKSDYRKQLDSIEVILYPKFKDQIEVLLRKDENTEEDKWNKLIETFDIQNVRDIKIENILKK